MVRRQDGWLGWPRWLAMTPRWRRRQDSWLACQDGMLCARIWPRWPMPQEGVCARARRQDAGAFCNAVFRIPKVRRWLLAARRPLALGLISSDRSHPPSPWLPWRSGSSRRCPASPGARTLRPLQESPHLLPPGSAERLFLDQPTKVEVGSQVLFGQVPQVPLHRPRQLRHLL